MKTNETDVVAFTCNPKPGEAERQRSRELAGNPVQPMC